jgi:lipopolysaccharide biosynthesis glycosyltransferase
LYSAAKSSSQSFELILGYDSSSLSKSSRSLIQDTANALSISVEFVEVSVPAEISSEGHLAPSSYIRLLLSDLLEETFVWLDSDLVCEEGWEELLYINMPNPDVILYAAYDPIANIEWEKSENASVRNAQGTYFNSGVLVIDGKGWSRLGFDENWKTLIRKYKELNFQWADQCILNFLASRNFVLLHPKLNYQEQARNFQPPCDPSIRHFAGPIKPWKYKSIGPLIWVSPFSQKSVVRYLELQSDLQSHFLGNGVVSKQLETIFEKQIPTVLGLTSHLKVVVSMNISKVKIRTKVVTAVLKALLSGRYRS